MQISSSPSPTWESLLQGEPPINQTKFHAALTLDPSFQVSAASVGSAVEQLHHRLEAKIYQIGTQTQERLAKANERIFAANEEVRSKLMELAIKIKAVQEDPSLSPEQRRTKLQQLYAEVAKWRVRLKPPIDFTGLTQRIEAIVNDGSLEQKEKKEKIEALRQEAGLTRRETREIFTGRMEKIYHAAREELQSLRQESLERLGEQLKGVEAQAGPKSLQAVALRQEITQVDQLTSQYLQRLEQNESLYKGLYGGKSCIKRFGGAVGGFFKGVGTAIKKAVNWSPIGLLARVPGFKDILAPVLNFANGFIDKISAPIALVKTAINGVTRFFRNPLGTLKAAAVKFGSFIKDNWHLVIPRVLNFIPTIGPVLAKFSAAGIGIYRAIKTGISGLFSTGSETNNPL